MPVRADYSPSKAKLFLALLWNSSKRSKGHLFSALAGKWGQVYDSYDPSYFPMSEYYKKEMGEDLRRSLVLMAPPISRESFIAVKQWSMEMEKEMSENGQRTVNIDPGLICPEQLLLISTKPYAHRIYLGQNLYAELCYTYSQKKYRPLPWTYPDYVQEDVIALFERWRGE